MSLRGVTRELSLYLESQVREGLPASGVGWSLVLCFGAAYACYYLSNIAKVGALCSWEAARSAAQQEAPSS